jgi:hypothetical protein
VPVAYEWTVFATLTSLVVAVVALLATALFQQGAKIDRLTDRMDQRFERVDQRFDGVEARMREDKAELLGRMDVLAERITRLETG